MPQKMQLKVLLSDAEKVVTIPDGGLFLDVSSIQMFDANGAAVTDAGVVVTVGVSADGLSYQSKVASSNASLGGFEFKRIKLSVSGRTTASTVVVDVKVCSISEAMTSDSYKSRLAGLFTVTPYTSATLPASLPAGTSVAVSVRNSGVSDALVSDGERYSSPSTGSKSVGRFIKNATAANTIKLRTAFRKSIGGFAGNDSYFCFPGDSTTVGIGANGVADGTANCREYSFVTKLSQILAAKFAAKTANGNLFTGHNIAYDKYATYNPRAALTNVTINNSYTGGANSVFTNSGGTGATIVYTPGVGFTSITVYYIQGPGLGSFTTQIDGGSSLGTVSTANATKAIKSVTYTGLSGTASSNVTLTFVGAANSVFIEGFTVGTGNSAINMINFGASGLKVSNFNDATDEWRSSYIPAALAPSVAFIQLGINDCKDSTVDASTYAANLTTMITTWKSAGVEVYVVGKLPSNPAYNAYTAVTRQNDLVDAAYSAAVANSVPFVDLYGYMDSYAYQSGMGMMTDGLHGNAGLYADEALFLANCIEHIASKI